MKVGDPGTMVIWPRTAPVPEGWMTCDGGAYHKDVSPALWNLFHSVCAARGDPPEVFRVPNAAPLIPPNAVVQLIIKL